MKHYRQLVQLHLTVGLLCILFEHLLELGKIKFGFKAPDSTLKSLGMLQNHTLFIHSFQAYMFA